MVIEGVPLLAMAATTGHCPFYANGVLKPLPGNIMEGILLQAKKTTGTFPALSWVISRAK